jgi:hypothetical protein
MPADGRQTSERNSRKDDADVVTAGQIFSDGVIELVSSADLCRPNLVFWDGYRAIVAPRIRRGGVWYRAPQLCPSIGRIMRLPDHLDQGESVVQLFADVSALFQEYLALPRELAQQVTLWMTSTWLADVVPSPPVLLISGPHMGGAVDLFQVVGCGSRRALSLTGINRAALVGLPMDLRPSLLINQPDLPQGMSRLLRACNHRGVNVPGKSGTVQDWVVSKAIFTGMAPSPGAWDGEALWISLPSAETHLPLDQLALARLAQDLQAKFLAFRLDWLYKTREGGISDGGLSFAESELAQSLFACVRHEPGLIEIVTPFLSGLVEDVKVRRDLDPNLVVLEVLWEPAHQLPELSVQKITEYLNLKVRIRGGPYEYSAEEVGWILKGHGFDRRRNGSGKVLRFSGDNTRLVHRLVRRFGLDLPEVPGCADCAGPNTIVAQESM